MTDDIVRADVKIVPAKRRASYDVPIESDREKPRRVTANVETSKIKLASGWPGAAYGKTTVIEIPKTREAVSNLIALLDAVDAELVEQGITE